MTIRVLQLSTRHVSWTMINLVQRRPHQNPDRFHGPDLARLQPRQLPQSLQQVAAARPQLLLGGGGEQELHQRG